MSEFRWADCAPEEVGIMIGAREFTVLAYVNSGDALGNRRSDAEIGQTVMAMVDRGWIKVCRFERWISPDGTPGLQYGPAIPREDLPAILADPATWDDPQDESWIGAITIARADGWFESRSSASA